MADANYLVGTIAGANMASSDGTTQKFPLGTLCTGTNGTIWMYVQAVAAAVRQYAWCTIDQSYNLVEGTPANALKGNKVGFPQFAFASGEYGWVPLTGVNIKTLALASIQPNVALYTSGSSGNLGTTVTGHTKIVGVVITATAGTATTGNTVNMLASYPQCSI